MRTKLRAKDLRGKKREELLKKLEELKTELSTLRVAKITGGTAQKLSKMFASLCSLLLIHSFHILHCPFVHSYASSLPVQHIPESAYCSTIFQVKIY